MTIIRLSLLIALVGILSACSNKENIEEPNNNSDKPREVAVNVQFQDYGEEEVINSRTGKQASLDTLFQEAKDLGNGITAVVTMHKDTVKPSPKTRAGGADEETCTLVVFKGSTVMGEVSGKTNRSGSFITGPSGNIVKLILPPDTYKLVCYNDKITRNGTKFTVKRDANLEDAYMGVNNNFELKPVAPGDPFEYQYASMSLSHVCSRVRFGIISYYDMAASDMTVSGQTSADMPKSSSFDITTEQWSTEEGGGDGYNWPYPAERCGVDEMASHYSNNYQLFLPSTQLSKLKVTFNSGNTYKRNLSGVTFNLQTNKKLELNGQYRVDLFLLYNFLYLYSDGSVGYPKEAKVAGGPKIPIAVVISQSQRLAIGLKALNRGCTFSESRSPYSSTEANHTDYTTVASAATDMNGYEWTYGNSINGFGVKAYNSNFPAFFECGKYTAPSYYIDENKNAVNTTIPLTNNLVGKKWHLGSLGEWTYAYRVLGQGTDSWNSTTDSQDVAWDAQFFYSAFRQMGFQNSYYTYTYNAIPTSTEYDFMHNWQLGFYEDHIEVRSYFKEWGYGFFPFIRY